MKNCTSFFSRSKWRICGIGLLAIAIVIAVVLFQTMQYKGIFFLQHENRLLPVGLTGVHHMGERFSVSEFYVNGYSGGNISNEGGGGSIVCCVMLPEKWHEGLVAEIRWSVADWSQENEKETKVGNYRSVIWTDFHAFVPVEKYTGPPEQLYAHFFADGRARIVSSVAGSESTEHPIKRNDSTALRSATIGKVVTGIFTPSDRYLNSKDREGKDKNGGIR